MSRVTRRGFLQSLSAGVVLGWLPHADAAGPRIEVYKSPSCGCCKDWITHLEANGLRARVRDTGNEQARRRLGMPERYASCHTGVIAGYVIEGHVPAREILRLLRERPAVLGLAVPGMPIGSPGMDGPEYLGRRDPYDVLIVGKDGSSRSYQRYQ